RLDRLRGSLPGDLRLLFSALTQSRQLTRASLKCFYFSLAGVAVTVAHVASVCQGIRQVERHCDGRTQHENYPPPELPIREAPSRRLDEASAHQNADHCQNKPARRTGAHRLEVYGDRGDG